MTEHLAYEGVAQNLIDQFGRLPGVGPKSAQRISFFLLQTDQSMISDLIEVLEEVRDGAKFCERCGNLAHGTLCRICTNPSRDGSRICVVEEWKDVAVIERMAEYKGHYHVLGGALSPIDGIGPDDINIRELLGRIEEGGVEEIILATDPNLEGEATAHFIARLLSGNGLIITKLASGLPVGGDLEFADEVTLGRAFEGRRTIG